MAILGNFVNRTLVLTNNYYKGETPARAKLDEYDESVLKEIGTLKSNVEANIDSFRFKEALKEAINLARLGNKYLADTEPWKVIKTDPERVKTTMNISLQITANLTILLEPFLPFSMEKLRGWLNLGKKAWQEAGNQDLLLPGHKIGKPSLLFEKIEDEDIKKQIDKLMASKELNDLSSEKTIPSKDLISFDDFSKIDIRTATVLEAEKVPKTTKLLKLKIDTGLDVRTIVSGIAEYFDPQALIGKQISVVANLSRENKRHRVKRNDPYG